MPVASPKPREYPLKIVRFARRLHEEKGYSAYRIRIALTRYGHRPAEATIMRWIDEDYAEGERMRKRRSGSPGPARRRGWQRRFARMEELRSLNISYRSIAVLMSHEFDDVDLTTGQVEYILRGGAPQQTIQRLLWPKARSFPSTEEAAR